MAVVPILYFSLPKRNTNRETARYTHSDDKNSHGELMITITLKMNSNYMYLINLLETRDIILTLH